MKNTALILALFICALTTAEAAPKPIKALLITGGCCHDYAGQKEILTKGISARTAVEWTIVHQGGTSTASKIPFYEKADWAKGFDVVVHNECFSDAKEVEWVERVLKPHREGVPAVVIHCAMHCYRSGTDKWFEFCGVTSRNHGAHYGYTVENLAKDDKIMARFGDTWNTPKGELYNIEKVWPGTTVLAQAKRKEDNKPQAVIWKHEYHGVRVFGTTIGHYNETMAQPQYLDYATRGLLWAAGKLGDAEIKVPNPEAFDLKQITPPKK